MDIGTPRCDRRADVASTDVEQLGLPGRNMDGRRCGRPLATGEGARDHGHRRAEQHSSTRSPSPGRADRAAMVETADGALACSPGLHHHRRAEGRHHVALRLSASRSRSAPGDHEGGALLRPSPRPRVVVVPRQLPPWTALPGLGDRRVLAVLLVAPWYSRPGRSMLPEVRLITLLRHPVDRAYSHFQHSRHYGVETEESFERALDLEPLRTAAGWAALEDGLLTDDSVEWYSYARRSRYAPQLRRWLEAFPAESLLSRRRKSSPPTRTR